MDIKRQKFLILGVSKSGYSAGCRNIIVMDSSNKAEEYRVLPGVIKVINNFSIDPQELLM